VIEILQEQYLGALGDENPLTLKQASWLIDCIDSELYKVGTIGIKAPDVWVRTG